MIRQQGCTLVALWLLAATSPAQESSDFAIRGRVVDAAAKPVSGGALIEARLLDANGRLCLDARSVVRFGITGDGELVCNLGTAGGSRKVELANGRAGIRVRLKGAAVVSASAEGVPTSFVSVEA